ncbi:hypothetical protein CEXT_142231 [Caerostris extrusa]|uniref:C2H2-type domain-containing protein n=1 Tax=Caerostris extrusa TaxID=172846 RepID=A0AAV4T274_CAEEX|nr:hypothetical protein CEXT_142231 [Caerostris extrusa]
MGLIFTVLDENCKVNKSKVHAGIPSCFLDYVYVVFPRLSLNPWAYEAIGQWLMRMNHSQLDFCTLPYGLFFGNMLRCRCCASLESEEEFEARLFTCEGCGAHQPFQRKAPRLHQLLVHKEGPCSKEPWMPTADPLNYFGDLPVLPPNHPQSS